MRVNSTQFGKYMQYPNYGSKFEHSYFPYFSKKWDSLESSLKNIVFFKEFNGMLKDRLNQGGI